jgi:hypothetical protein
MQEDQEDFDDKNYPEDYDDHGSLDSKYKHYFKFDPEAWDAWGKWLYDALNEVVEISPNVWYAYGFPSKSIPVSSYLSNAGKGNTFQYLGNNYQKIPIWKKKYFVSDIVDYNNFTEKPGQRIIKSSNTNLQTKSLSKNFQKKV